MVVACTLSLAMELGDSAWVGPWQASHFRLPWPVEALKSERPAAGAFGSGGEGLVGRNAQRGSAGESGSVHDLPAVAGGGAGVAGLAVGLGLPALARRIGDSADGAVAALALQQVGSGSVRQACMHAAQLLRFRSGMAVIATGAGAGKRHGQAGSRIGHGGVHAVYGRGQLLDAIARPGQRVVGVAGTARHRRHAGQRPIVTIPPPGLRGVSLPPLVRFRDRDAPR